MTLLLVAATSAEVQPIVSRLAGPASLSSPLTRFIHRQRQIDVLVTGVGMVATAVWCAKTLAETTPDLALNVGVCGSFKPAFPPGTVVQVVSDRLPELGAEDDHEFLTIQELGLLGTDEPPFRAGRLVNVAPPSMPALMRLPQAHGITVNTAHGYEPSIRRIVERWAPDVESMEGAAFMYACMTAGVPCAQVRAVSNRVERRNRANWKLAEAIASLTDEVTNVIEEL
jgi:futalosine hydrolase